MKKVNFLLPCFGYKPMGGFKIVYTYANLLKRRGYTVNIIYAYSMNKTSVYKYIRDKALIKLNKPKWYKLEKEIREYYCLHLNEVTVPNADITVATAWNTAEILNKLSSKKGKKIYLIQSYEIWSGSKKQVDKTWKYNMEKIVISKWLYNIGLNLGCNTMTYIPNSIDYTIFNTSKCIETRDNVVSMLYSNNKWKGSKEGIEVLKIVKKYIPDLRVILFGTEKRNSMIPSWMEYFENPEQRVLVDEIYNASAVFLCSSWYEGWGLPAMEAMSCGCAVVTTKNGGVEDFAIDEKTALLCDVRDEKQMSNAIMSLLLDKDKRIRIASTSMKYIHKFTWDKSFHKFRKLIENE